ncbi:hypothetical protein GCM10008018_41330 [Paenibacillus marchantiophytorum]|uniref:Endospore appendages core domain-containing protein n=1 Tax=Paenibacillus marchantiophytorum TaxID=1619310 RepID=A0ABQ1EWN5_9BACL|nr:S-Ena type endospore appendage [Paenibacillus marchantiophytorum]GFZ90664.1 hypothetical protein GCM10008018_41330 [Paenibacillus marchantiophytorum]
MCHTATDLSCCSEKIIVQDKVCTNWQLVAAGTQTLFTDNISQIITGTGYVKSEIGTGTITVNFLRTGVVAPIQTITIPAGGSSSFSVARFNTISVTTTAAAQGEFCITVRYSL